jgi:hypothetical protein
MTEMRVLVTKDTDFYYSHLGLTAQDVADVVEWMKTY